MTTAITTTTLERPPPALAIHELVVELTAGGRAIPILDGVSLSVARGEAAALVGESGCGKTLLARAITGLLPRGFAIRGGTIDVDGAPWSTLTDEERRPLLGRRVAMMPQDPATALNPRHTIGAQIAEAIDAHTPLPRAERAARVHALLDEVELTPGTVVARRAPHELSGGMRQRAVLAVALAARPGLLIADEPTSAVDNLTARELLALLERRRAREGMALLLISHDLELVAAHATRVHVMYAGQLVEHGPRDAVFAGPRHPYTAALLAARPRATPPRLDDGSRARLPTIPGRVPPQDALPSGCRFRDRCPSATDACAVRPVTTIVDDGHGVACHHPRGAA